MQYTVIQEVTVRNSELEVRIFWIHKRNASELIEKHGKVQL